MVPSTVAERGALVCGTEAAWLCPETEVDMWVATDGTVAACVAVL